MLRWRLAGTFLDTHIMENVKTKTCVSFKDFFFAYLGIFGAYLPAYLGFFYGIYLHAYFLVFKGVNFHPLLIFKYLISQEHETAEKYYVGNSTTRKKMNAWINQKKFAATKFLC
jgi:hypothetical protein